MTASNKSEFKRRRFPRVKTPVYYRPASVSETSRQTSNISLGGVRIHSNKPLKEGQALEVELFLPSGKSIVALAKVVWVKALPPGSDALYDVGLEFIKLPAEAIDELKLVLENTSSQK